ncbi:MAG: TIGR02996 domain-containing protein [Planctomycetaceae bacterium]|nr:TIGR02996 domain-containing protein [Planctomycetaceae bacterium]
MPKRSRAETDRDGLIQEIIACPEDDSGRLALAACLDKNGEKERAKFIRMQIELTQINRYTDAWEKLFHKQLELRWKHEGAWGSGLPHARGGAVGILGFWTKNCHALGQLVPWISSRSEVQLG